MNSPNYQPIIAYCNARIDSLRRLEKTLARESVIAELNQIIILCRGLEKQFALINGALNFAE